jgi:hypothetical protein
MSLFRVLPYVSLVAFAFAASACHAIKVPETHSVGVNLSREWRGLPAGDNTIELTIHPEGGPTKTEGFWHPIVTVPVELTLKSTNGSPLALFASKDMNHTYQTVQIEGMGRDCTRDVDTFDGHNDDGTRIQGKVTSEYAMHYVVAVGK